MKILSVTKYDKCTLRKVYMNVLTSLYSRILILNIYLCVTHLNKMNWMSVKLIFCKCLISENDSLVFLLLNAILVIV